MRDVEYFTEQGLELLKTGDLFAETDTIVIPIKTKGRSYGILSRTVAARGIVIPDVVFGCAVFVARAPKPNIVFVAFWEDQDHFQDLAHFHAHVSNCAGNCVHTARYNNVKRLAFPLLGGNRGMEALPAMALAIQHEIDHYDIVGAGPEMPEFVILTDKHR